MSVPYIAKSTPLSQSQFDLLLAQCASSSDPIVLRSVAHIESHFDPLVLHNDTKHVSLTVPSLLAGAEQAKRWISLGDSVDIGLMQINSGNLSVLGMTVADALDPCRSLDAGARILSAAYAQGASAADRRAALLIALSRYNTGRTLAGLANGYVERVLSAQVNPAKSTSAPLQGINSHHADWDVWAIASTAQQGGAAWLIGSLDTHDFLIGAGAQRETGEPHAMSQGPGTAPGM